MTLSSAAWFVGAFNVILLASLMSHEAGHIAVAKSAGSPATIIYGGLRIGILHGRLGRKAEWLSLVAGSLAGLLTAGCLTGIIWLLSHQFLATFGGASLSLFHLFSLSPLYGDGRALTRLLNRQDATNAHS